MAGKELLPAAEQSQPHDGLGSTMEGTGPVWQVCFVYQLRTPQAIFVGNADFASVFCR